MNSSRKQQSSIHVPIGRVDFYSGRSHYLNLCEQIATRVRNELPRRINRAAAIRTEARGRAASGIFLGATKYDLVKEFCTQAEALHSPSTAVSDILRFTDHFGAVCIDRDGDWPRFTDGGAMAFVGDMATKALEADVLALLTDID